MIRFARCLPAALLLCAALSLPAQPLPPLQDTPYPGVIRLNVDATDTTRKIFRVRETLPVQPGPMALFYPRWLPGDHAPTGEVSQLAGLRITANGQPVPWSRNALDTHAFHLTVPAGVSTLELEFQFLSALSDKTGRTVVTPEIIGLQWNSVVLYPAGHAAAQVQVQPTLTLPQGWRYGTALRAQSAHGATVEFPPVSLETLIDSPVFAGRHFQRFELDGGSAPVALNLVADDARQLRASPEALAAHRALVLQADKVFGPRRYAHYDFLLASSDSFGWIGLEHHQSSENGLGAGYFTDWATKSVGRELLAHEYVHSWNGKYRRPADLWTPHFNTPMRDSLLWVYEGQTEFWGLVLAARSGLVSPADMREDLANLAAWLSTRSGRAWRNLQDTTQEPLIAGRQWATDWRDWQRGADYYGEGALLWLEADMLIRERSGGRRSLDDVARAFFGAAPGRTAPLTYEFDDVMRALNAVEPLDWATFWRERLDRHDGSTLLAGLTAAGWKLAWADTPTERFKAWEANDEVADFSHSLGLSIGKDDKLVRVIWNSPAFTAGLAQGMTVVAVNLHAYTPELLRDAITDARTGGPLELLVKSGDRFRVVTIDWKGGLRYPTLQRIAGTPDRLSELFKPRP